MIGAVKSHQSFPRKAGVAQLHRWLAMFAAGFCAVVLFVSAGIALAQEPQQPPADISLHVSTLSLAPGEQLQALLSGSAKYDRIHAQQCPRRVSAAPHTTAGHDRCSTSTRPFQQHPEQRNPANTANGFPEYPGYGTIRMGGYDHRSATPAY